MSKGRTVRRRSWLNLVVAVEGKQRISNCTCHKGPRGCKLGKLSMLP